MQLTIQAIVGNLVSAQSEELMQKHLSDDRFPGVWSAFMACRYLSFTSYGIPLLDLMNDVAETKDPKLAYRTLFAACKNAKRSGNASNYTPSPFTE